MDNAAATADLSSRGEGKLPGHLGLKIEAVGAGLMRGSFEVAEHHLAPNGYLHAGSVVTLADTACGYGCFVNRPDGAENFTTIELKSNFVGTARSGRVEVEAKLLHGGRTTQVWDATVSAGGKPIAYFRCTQMLLYPRAAG